MKALWSAAFLLTFLFSIHAQPDDQYFQQGVDYTIDIILDDEAHMLRGVVEVEYTNNSPTPLSEIYFHLWPNAYKDVNTPLAAQLREQREFDLQFSSEEERGYIDSLSFSVDSEQVEYQMSDTSSEVVLIPLGTPLASGSSCVIRTPFRLKIPSAEFSRLGHVGSSYQITQWYPKPVVYDHDGWHPMPYLSMGEFYSEFGSFQVDITLPSNYLVGATGRMDESTYEGLLSRSKLISEARMRWDNSFPPSLPTMVTHHYEQDSIHDFAWFADKRFNVLHDTVILPGSGRVVDAWVLYTNSHADVWEKSMEYVKDGTRFYSGLVGEYPYDHVTVVDGTIAAGGGMEYPMITVVNSTTSASELERVIVHEIGHNWFYGILGNNEREHAWMDEGINTFYEVRYFEEKYGRGSDQQRPGLAGLIPENRELNYLGYLFGAREHQDQGLDICAHRYTRINYGTMVYGKAGLLMQYLRAVLGDASFDSAMQEYYIDHRFTHPAPIDLQRSMENSTGEDLSWLFDDLVKGRKKIDFVVDEYDASTQMVMIGSRTSFNGPVPVGFYRNGMLLGITNIVSGIPARSGFTDVDRIRIDPNRDVPEIDRKNNSYKVNGAFKRSSGLEVKGLTRTGADDRRLLFVNPSITWNDQDKWMLGANLTNFEAVAKDFEWTVSPMYSISSQELVGYARGRYEFWMGEESPNRITLGMDIKRYSTLNTPDLSGVYTALKPSIGYTFIQPSLKDGTFTWVYTAHVIREEIETTEGTRTTGELYHTLDYSYTFGRGLFSTGLYLELEGHEDFFKPSLILKNSLVYNRHAKRVSLRLYGAKLWRDDEAFIGSAVLGLSGQSGRQSLFSGDYRYDFLFLGRSATDGLLSQQHVRNRGGFNLDSSIGTSDDWVASAGLAIELPLPIDISAYANGGLYRQSKTTIDGTFHETRSLYEGGLRFSTLFGLLDVSVPLVYSPSVQDIYEANDVSFGERIRFQLRLEKLVMRDMLRSLEF